MKIGDVFPSNYLKASDLNGSAVPVTIDHVAIEPVGREKEARPVIYFVGKSKGVVLNKTNARKIVEIAGSDDTEDWAGVQIVLFSAMVEFQGDTVESIRVKAPSAKKPAARQSQPPPPPVVDVPDISDDDIPF
jgi:hypothetical protein